MEHRKKADLLYLEKGVKEYGRMKGQEEIPGFRHKDEQKHKASSGDSELFGVIIEKDGKPSMLPHQGARTHHLGDWKKPDQTQV